ncbi:acyl carrier protein [Streptomyces hoynatensis]|uniref:Carrier domain-containing protein n=1 Tax=Streptomyces hoynatensis TaxID=1141874 RepID=A0A3A9YYV4_9ACTN|nr:acyl carrier protein [Streptomyces hoynatensis]RKN41218.1 hypothetical protein D7294_15925 [Streptomyces hoynatensis]
MSEPAESAPAAQTKELEEFITAKVAHYLQTSQDAIDPELSLTEYGLDSLYAVSLCGDIEDAFHTSVPLTLIWDYDTVRSLAAAVSANLQEAAS